MKKCTNVNCKHWNDTAAMWTKNWPDAIGSYWFFGWLHKMSYSEKPRLYYVEVRKGANSLFFITHGTFIYEDGYSKGMWRKIELPELPEICINDFGA